MTAALIQCPAQSAVRRFKIGAIGISTQELSTINSAILDNTADENHFTITPITTDTIAKAGALDFFILGNCDSRSLLAWQHFARTHRLSKPVIRMVSKSAPNPHGYFMQLPLENSTIKAVLDTYVETELPIEVSVSPVQAQKISPIKATKRKTHHTNQLFNRILLIDDNFSVRLLLESILSDRGIRADLYDCPQQALGTVEKHRYDLIFINTTLSHLNGFALCKQIKQGFMNRITPIVLLSSNTTTFDKIRGKLAGSDACIDKPSRANELLQIAQQIYGTVA